MSTRQKTTAAYLPGPPRQEPCRPSCLQSNWQDHPPTSGKIATTCGQCGKFIGFRPADSQRDKQ